SSSVHGAPLPHAVTMTAELSQMFRSKREGVAFVLDAVGQAFPGADIVVYTVDGRFLSLDAARDEPLAVAAANWAATSRVVASRYPNAILVDTGTTTTDIIPIVGGRVVAEGTTDPDRLASGELVYSGAVRTPTEAMAPHVWIGGRRYGVSAEGFALSADVHVWRGDLASRDYSVSTPDGRPPDRPFAGERLRRVICADPELADDARVSEIAGALAGAQVARIADAIIRVRAGRQDLKTAVVTGLGSFLGAAAARTAGLDVVRLADELGTDAAEFAPAAAVALLRAREGRDDRLSSHTVLPAARAVGRAGEPRATRVDVVVKVGGSLLSHPSHLNAVMAVVLEAARRARVLVVPGGGPFADAVRSVDRTFHLSDDAAHWAALRAMDQLADVLADKYPGAQLVADAQEAHQALRKGRVPVLEPYRWLRSADPLPHTWDVTSDSIAAWVAGALGARRLVVVKAPSATGELLDGHFARALPAGVESHVVTADDLAALGLRCSF
ncbi:MAG TPA: hydantoinase/oxoprolinase family protein, partial [Vicinamibacterales bacterium]